MQQTQSGYIDQKFKSRSSSSVSQKIIDESSITGEITFQRLSNQKLDFTEEIKLSRHEQLIPQRNWFLGNGLSKLTGKLERMNIF